MKPLSLWDYVMPWRWKRLGELWREAQVARSEATTAKQELSRLRAEVDRFTAEAAAVVRKKGGAK